MISVIGGSGFVGSKLINNLGSKNCSNLDKRESVFFHSITTIADITKFNEIKFHENTKVVVLLAAEHKDNVSPSSLYYDVNVEGTRNVLKKMDQCGIKNLIFTSSVAIYGLNKFNPNEDQKPDPFNHYGKSKLQAELMIKKWYENDSINKSITIIRPTVIFGERNRGNVYNLFNMINSKRFIMIGSGKNKKSIAYLDNIVNFIIDRINNSKKGFFIYNYADKPDLSMNDLTSIVKEKLNLKPSRLKVPYVFAICIGYFFDFLSKLTTKKFNISSIRVKKFCSNTKFDAIKAHQIFDPPFTLEYGIDKTIEYEFLSKNKDDVIFYSE